jgi:hypothetical protein
MRIGFDLDGVLADLHGAYAWAAMAMFPGIDRAAMAAMDVQAGQDDEEDASPGDAAGVPAPAPPLTRQQADAVWDRLCGAEDFWESLGEIENGAIERLAAIALEHRWEVIFLTSRPFAPGKTVQRQSQLWLERRKFPLPSVFVVHGSRGRIADALRLDVVVDDRPQNCLDVVLESKARAILVWRGELGAVPGSAKRLGIGVVPSVAACLDTLLEAGREAGNEDDFMSRLRRLLGLQPKAAKQSR